MPQPVSIQPDLNQGIVPLDDNRRRLGIASLQGKIKSCLHLLRYADVACIESMASYNDPAKSEAHLYSCMEGIYTALSEVSDHCSIGIALTSKIVGDNSVPPLEKFAATMRKENGIA